MAKLIKKKVNEQNNKAVARKPAGKAKSKPKKPVTAPKSKDGHRPG